VTEHYTYHTLSREVVEELKQLRPELVVGFIVPINFGGVPNVKADFIIIEQQSYSSRFDQIPASLHAQISRRIRA
jgi:glycerophosphoryl diester phosphodiesterase